MELDLAHKIAAHPAYQRLKTTRSSFGWWLTAAGMIVYYGFILLVAFDKSLLAAKLGPGVVTSVGMPLGVAVILFTIIITWIYVRRANGEFDGLTREITKAVLK